jgi:hypothetical protein
VVQIVFEAVFHPLLFFNNLRSGLHRPPQVFHKISTGINGLFLSKLPRFCTNARAFGMALQEDNSPVCGKTGVSPPIVPTMVTLIYSIVSGILSLIWTAGLEA